MFRELPQIAQTRYRRHRHGWHVILGRIVYPQHRVQLPLAESRERQIQIQPLQVQHFRGENVHIPLRLFVASVIHEPQLAHLRRAQMLGHQHRALLQPNRFARGAPQVPDDDYAFRIDNNGLDKSEFVNAGADFLNGGSAPFARVFRIINGFINRPFNDFHSWLFMRHPEKLLSTECTSCSLQRFPDGLVGGLGTS